MATYGAKNMLKNGAAIDFTTEQCPISDYGRSKMMAEQYILAQNNSVKKTIIRVPTLYDNIRNEYFEFYKTLLLKLPFLPQINGNTKRSILHIDNLCYLIEKVASGEVEDSVILPCDKYVPDVNDIMRKITDDLKIRKRKSKIFGKLLNVFYWIHPFVINLVGNAYYAEKSAYMIDKKSLFDFSLLKE